MIDRLTGQVVAAGATWAVVSVGGLGLRAWCTPATASRLRPGVEATLHTTLVPREDSLTLYGFGSSDERDAFELVQTASGVGPKLALAIVSVFSPGDLATAIAQEDVKRLTSVPGIGAKGAQKIIIELKDKVAGLAASEVVTLVPTSTEPWREQVVAGLQGLGWSAKDADAAAEKVAPMAKDQPDLGVAQLMRAALQTLAR